MDHLKNYLLLPLAEDADIQDKLYAWLEDKGHVNKMRGYIREQLIAALKDGAAENVANKANVASSMVQAVNLLVADFLVNQKYMYTLSVFISEVPLLASLLRFSPCVNSLDVATPTNPIIERNYDLNEVREILNTLGFQPDSDVVKLTCQYYLYSDRENLLFNSLLPCLFKAITTIKNNFSEHDKIQNNENISNTFIRIEGDTPEDRLNNLLEIIEEILRPFNLNEQQKNILKRLLEKYHQNNNTQKITDYQEEYIKNLELLKKDIAEKMKIMEEYMLQIKQIENGTEQLHLEQKQLYTLINICEEKEKSVRKSEEECKKVLQDLKNQKNELRRKEIEIWKLEKRLKKKPTKLEEQNFDLTRHMQEWKLDKPEAFKMLGFEQTSLNKISNDIQRIDTSLDREMVKKLQRENHELREFIKNQRQRIEELSNRTSNLTNQMEKTHKKSPKSTVTTNYCHKRNTKKKRNDNSNKKPYTDQNISSTTTTDNSRTVDNQIEDDTIKIARLRLKSLEKNTEEVEQNLNFQKENFLTNRECHNIVMCDKRLIFNNSCLPDDMPSHVPFYSHDFDFPLFYEVASDLSYVVYGNMLKNSNVNNIDSPINEGNCDTELPMNRSDMSAQTPNEDQSQIKMPVIKNKIVPNYPEPSCIENQTSNELIVYIETNASPLTVSDNGGRLKKNINMITSDSQQTPPTTVAWQDKSNDVDSSSTSKKEEHEGAISFGSSDNTNSSSDLWTYFLETL